MGAICSTWCQTERTVAKSHFTWTIKNFSFFKNLPSETINSCSFTIKNSDASQNLASPWQLQLQTRSVNEEAEEEEYISLFLQLINANQSNSYYNNHQQLQSISALFKFALIDDNQEEVHTKEILTPELFTGNKSAGFKFFLKWSTLITQANTLLPNDTLTVHCYITLLYPYKNIHGEHELEDRKIWNQWSLDRDLKSLFENTRFADVTVSTGDKEFKVHKAVLGARSRVFANMFEHSELEECKQNRLEINDISSEAMCEVLRFIYYDSCDEGKLFKLAHEVLPAAEKFQLEKLKVICEIILCRKLSKKNAIQTLVLADKNNAKQLKQKTLEFIGNPSSGELKVSNSPSSKNTPSLCDNLLHAIIQPRTT